jgi:signal transduction histidine kinase
VLALSRLTTEPPTAGQLGTIDDLVDASRHRWHSRLASAGRRLDTAVTPAVAALLVPLNPYRQVLDILLDNATIHGHGTVRITAREALDTAAIEITDEGHLDDTGPDPFRRGVTTHPGTGIGLPLARNLAESQAARLTLTSTTPTTFTLLLRAHPPTPKPTPEHLEDAHPAT